MARERVDYVTRTYRVLPSQEQDLALALVLAKAGLLETEARDLSGIVREALDAWLEQRRPWAVLKRVPGNRQATAKPRRATGASTASPSSVPDQAAHGHESRLRKRRPVARKGTVVERTPRGGAAGAARGADAGGGARAPVTPVVPAVERLPRATSLLGAEDVAGVVPLVEG